MKTSLMIVTLLLGCLSFWVGVRYGRRIERINAAKWGIVHNLHILHLIGSNNDAKLKSDIKFVVFACVNELNTSGKMAADDTFKPQLTEAIIIAEEVRTGLVSFSTSKEIKKLNDDHKRLLHKGGSP